MASVELWSEGSPPQVLEFTQHVTHGSFSAGDLVSVASNGKLRIAQADTAILGIARKKYTSDTLGTAKIPVELISTNSIYSVRITDTGGDTTTGATDTLIGDGMGFINITTGGSQVVGDTSGDSAVAYCVGRDPRDDSGTVGGRILIRFKPAALMEQY